MCFEQSQWLKCDDLYYPLNTIFIRFGSKLYGQIRGIPVGTNCASLVADLFQFSYERGFMLSLSDNSPDGVIDAFNSLVTDYLTVLPFRKACSRIK